MPFKITVLSVLFSILAVSFAYPLFWPQPQQLSLNQSAVPLYISPCDVRYKVDSKLYIQVAEMLTLYQGHVFKCKELKD